MIHAMASAWVTRAGKYGERDQWALDYGVSRERFGWQPTHPSLLEDLEAGNYPV
jgi:hypothetical protein